MTLIMNTTVGVVGDRIPDPFVIVTTDTRRVVRELYTDTFEYVEGILERTDDSYDKVVQASNNVLLAIGGTWDVSKEMREFILKRTKEHYFLDDYEQIIKEGYNHLKKSDDKIIRHFIDTPDVYVCLIGFWKNGNPGTVKLGEDGEIHKRNTIPDSHTYNIFSPSEDMDKRQDELMDFYNSPVLHQAKTYIDIYANHLTFLHALLASQEVETISSTCLVHFLMRQGENIYYETHELDLTENVKQIQMQYQE